MTPSGPRLKVRKYRKLQIHHFGTTAIRPKASVNTKRHSAPERPRAKLSKFTVLPETKSRQHRRDRLDILNKLLEDHFSKIRPHALHVQARDDTRHSSNCSFTC